MWDIVNMERKIEISTKTVGWTILMILVLFFILKIFDVVVVLFVAFLFSSALSPVVRFIEKRRIPRAVSIPLVFFVVLFLIFIAGVLIVPPLITQLIKFFEKLPFLLSGVTFLSEIDLSQFSSQFTMVGQNVFRVTKGVFSDVFSFISIFVLTFYMLYERKNIEKTLRLYFGQERGEKFFIILGKIEDGLGAWVRGQALLGFIIGAATFIGLSFLDIEYALPLSIIAGVLEIVPVIGPIISAVPAILVAGTSSLNLAVLTTLLYLTIQQLENHFIVPFVMRKAIGISPLLTIVSIMVGGNIAGIVGMLLAVPILVIIQTVFSELSSRA